jgi:25S rRNA (uracil2634-N3)-methyltransferase
MAKRKIATSKRLPKPSLNQILDKSTFKPTPVKTAGPARTQKKDKQAHKPKYLQQPQQQQKNQQPHQQRNQQPTIPFSVYDKILLVGEGDLSFTASLVLDHGAADVLATCFDSQEEVLEKYPSTASANIAAIHEAFSLGTDVTSQSDNDDEKVLYNIDATKLNKNKQLRSRGPFSRIFFNFPHTGGISTDVNRQVRHNQALLSSFFQTCTSILASEPPDVGEEIPAPSILVTIFEGEPYTLWNIRDLARSAGLSVERSFRFPAEVYPRYRHARTLGMVKKGGEEGEEESESAWKGETRPARMYEFRVKSDAPVSKKKKKRPGDESSSDEGA